MAVLLFFSLCICNYGQFAYAQASDETAENTSSTTPRSRIIAALQSMQLRHEMRPSGVPETYGWKSKPSVGMGTEPYGLSVRSSWPGRRFDNWHAMLSWFVIYEAEGGNLAKNSAVEISGVELWYLSKKEFMWKRLQSDRYPKWQGAYSLNAINKSNEALYIERRSTGLVLAPTVRTMVHGGLGQVETPWNSETLRADIAAVFISVKHRLVLKDPKQTDDRFLAKLIVQAGADYYPYVGARVADLESPSVPSIGLGRFILASENWRYSTMIVVAPGIREAEVLKGLPDQFDY